MTPLTMAATIVLGSALTIAALAVALVACFLMLLPEAPDHDW